ncbi:MAG: glutathione S-transferase family protein [Gammaproteobacteria bacterium]
MSTLALYTAEVCPYAQRTRMVLGEKQVVYDAIEIDLDDKPDWFVAMTPGQRVPVLKHDDFILGESATINEYLESVFDGIELAPADPKLQAVMRNEIKYFDSVFLPVFYQFLFAQESARQNELREDLYDKLAFLNEQVGVYQSHNGGGPWWLGTQITLADFSMFPFFERFEVFDHYRSFQLPTECGRLRTWWHAMCEREAVATTMHDLEYFIPRYVSYAGGTAQGLSAQAFRAGASN